MRTNVVYYLTNTVQKYPNKDAVIDSNGSFTFSTLLSNACDLSEKLAAFCIEGSPVGVYLPKGKEMVAAFAGINLSGGFYVPLDTHSPLSRVKSILSVLGSNVVVSDKSNAEKLSKEWDGEIILVDDIFRNNNDYERALNILEESTGIDTDPVYSIFTSGSTGTPKGVVVSHRGVLDYIDWAVETFKIDSTSVIGNQAPFYFDNSTLDIYLTYATGATLDIIPEMNFSFPAKLIDYLNDHKINFVFWVPFVLINVANFDIFKSKKPQYLRDVFFAGEVMPNKHLNYWRKHLPECRYANLYGPTEITVDCTYYVVDREFRDDEPLPIGKACKNSDVLILVDQQRQAKINEEGELCVRGTSLSLGYYNDWEKTGKAFIQNPLNTHYPEIIYCTGDIVYTNERGEIMYVGRKDAQIKHNGYRIELGEIENAVLATNLVDNCCAVYDFTNKKIVLFYQAVEELNMAVFRKAVSNSIPRYMLPTDYYREDMLKQNGSGKIDRAFYKKQVNG
jgi:amino acid adenylation domain-containing protein